jgi:hypothetical protein
MHYRRFPAAFLCVAIPAKKPASGVFADLMNQKMGGNCKPFSGVGARS